MSQSSGIWRFATLLRVIAIALAVIYGLSFIVIWGLAIAGDTEGAFELIDVKSQAPLRAWQLLAGIICTGVAFAAMGVIVWAASAFILVTRSKGFFITEASRTCTVMGYGLIAFWAGMVLSENVLPWILTRNLAAEVQLPLEWFILDDSFIALIVGLVLLLIAKAMDEARAIDADNKQFI